MTAVALHIQIANDMRAAGIWETMTPEQRLEEHQRRYRDLIMHKGIINPRPLTPAEIISGITGAAVDQAARAYAILRECARLRSEIVRQQNDVDYLKMQSRCNGWTHVNAAGSLYIHHKNGSPCPLHGDDIKDRGRVYVGRNIEKCQTAINALANYNAWHIAKQTLSDYQRDLRCIEADLGRVGGKQLTLFTEET